MKDELTQLVQQHQLNDSIDILGYVEDVENYYKYFDLVLFTSDWEGMPLTMWEAMANSVPIVAPDVGGFKEIIEGNNCGFVYEPANLIEAEDKILQLMDDEQLRKKIGANGLSAEVQTMDGYPGWQPNMGSPVLAGVREVYRARWGREPHVTAIHAGLECGLLGEKIPGLDMVSFGPQIEGAHSPDERVHVASVGRFWDALKEVLDRLSA